jgi:hypothetical protein
MPASSIGEVASHPTAKIDNIVLQWLRAVAKIRQVFVLESVDLMIPT